MLNFLIDVFCKDTIIGLSIGLSQFEDIRKNRLYKNKYSSLFKKVKNNKVKFSPRFIDQIACRS